MSVTTGGAGSVEEPEAAVLGPSTSISRPYAAMSKRVNKGQGLR
jgi:hypothetical protein